MQNILKYINKSKQSQLFWMLSLTTLFNFALVGFRLIYIDYDFSQIECFYDLARFRGKQTFFFLIWNLFLAWVPFWIAMSLEKISKSKILVMIGLISWLIFFPNAPYIITDLLHLKHRFPVPFWYDLMMIFSFGWTGLLLGFMSLMEVQKFLEKRLPTWLCNVLISISILLCGFGVYIGRFQRWNSWDVLVNPLDLTKDILMVLYDPLSHIKTFGIAIVLSVILFLGHWTFLILITPREELKR